MVDLSGNLSLSGRWMAKWEAVRHRPWEVVWRWAPGLGGYDVRHVGAHWRASQWCEVLEALIFVVGVERAAKGGR